MTPAFLSAFNNTVGIEGGYVNDPDDPGGETKFGISKRSYPNMDIKNLTLEDSQQIYWDDFWTYLNCDNLNPALAEYIFDFAVNSGRVVAAKALQKAVGSLPDGRVGPQTLAAIGRVPMRHIIRLVFVERACIMADAKNREKYEHGWFARLFDVTDRAMSKIGRIQ